MERTIYQNLLKWKDNPNKKPLILLGARQVGKTYILKEFGSREFDNLIYVNCHKDSFALNLFRNFDIKRIVTELERYYETDIVIGKTLIFFDEIQEIPNAIASLKYFCEDYRSLHVVAAGSLLGISLRNDESFPVGKVNMMKMFPMTFNEFLLANGRSKTVELLDTCDWESISAMDELLKEYLRQYYFVGGMPEAVLKYIETKDVRQVRMIQREILDTYYYDMSKHTKTQIQRIHQVWNNIPAQLSKENKKFFYGDIKKGARSKDYEMAMQWLIDAGLVYKVEKCKQPTIPLKFYADSSAFKLYMLDCGLLACLSEANPNTMLLNDNAFVEFKGAFTENFVLQHLKATNNISIFYYSKDNSTMEIDFLLQTEEKVIPIEVKASVNVKSKSLSLFVNEDFKDKNFKAVRFSLKPYIDQEWMENITLYAVDSYIRSILV
ncbi:MAG: ATP-binding protein [Bacteroidales bacterium]|nr:ATP-binding protein [Bacteroidales bacterium]